MEDDDVEELDDGVPVRLLVTEPVPVELADPVPVWLPVAVELLVLVAVALDEPVDEPVLDWLPVPVALGEPVPVEDEVAVDEPVSTAHSYTTAKRLCVPPHGSPRRASGCSVQAGRPTHSDLA